MRPLFTMVSKSGQLWGSAWTLAPAVECVLLELREHVDDGGPDRVKVVAYTTHAQPLGPVLRAAQNTLAQHCQLIAPAPSTLPTAAAPATEPAEPKPVEADSQAFHAHLDTCERCRNHPFSLCEVGDRLLRSSADAAMAQKGAPPA